MIKKGTSKLYRLIESFKKSLLNKVTKVNSAPIFILGNPKTGTTVIAALLAQSVGVSVTLDIRGMRDPVRTDLYRKKITLEDFVSSNKLDFSRKIIKDPNLTYLYDDLSKCFPASKSIFINRDPRSNIRSILNRLSLPGHLPQLQDSYLETLPPGWKGLTGSWLGLKGENYIEMLAARWNLAADVYLENEGNLTLIRYEDFCRDKCGEIYRLAERVGLTPVNDISNETNKQYQSRGNREISWLDFFGPDNLARIERICGDRMKKFGYVPSEGQPVS